MQWFYAKNNPMNIYADRINIEEFGPDNILKAIIAECENVDYLPKNTFDFRIYFSDNEDFNAVAYEVGSRSLINIFIFEGRYRIDEFDEPEIIPFDEQYKQLVFYSGPENPKRYSVAELIACFGIEFLLFHELGHHLGGHVRYLKDKMGLSELYAYHNELLKENSRLYQILETDADAVAITTLLESISNKISIYARLFLNHNAELIPHCLVIALTIVFYLLPRENSESYDLETSKYLPRDVRFYLVLDIMFKKMDSEYCCCKGKQSNISLLNTLSMTNSMLDELYSASGKQNSINIMTEEYRTYYTDILLSKWRDIRNELNQYAVIQLPE